METTEHFLTRVIGFLVRERDFADQFLSHIPQTMFTDWPVMDRTVAALRHWRQEYEEHPEVADLAAMCAGQAFGHFSKPDGEEEVNVVLDFFLDVNEEFQPSARKWVEQRLAGELRRAMALSALRDAADLVGSGECEPSDLRGLIGKLERAETFGIKHDFGTSIAHGLAERWARRERERTSIPRVPTGFGTLDGDLRGGMPLKSLGCVIARTGVGKTTALVHIAKHAMLYGYGVLYVTLEVPREEIEDRFDASLTRVRKADLLDFRREVESMRAAWRPKGGEDILVVEAEAQAFDVAQLDALVERMSTELQWNPAVTIVDYADLMLPAKAYEQRRFEIENIYVGLKVHAKRGPRVTWTASQSNRQGAKDKLITTLHMAEADVKGQTANVVISMNQTEDEKGREVFRFYVAKNTFGKGQATAGEFQMDLDTGNLIRGSATYGTDLPTAPGLTVVGR